MIVSNQTKTLNHVAYKWLEKTVVVWMFEITYAKAKLQSDQKNYFVFYIFDKWEMCFICNLSLSLTHKDGESHNYLSIT